jgi:hypothetical protein
MYYFVTNVVSHEEDPSQDKLNPETFNIDNDSQFVFRQLNSNNETQLVFRPFKFSNKSWTFQDVFDGKLSVPNYKIIGLGDHVCSCGETVYDDTLIPHNRGALSRIYIPRVMTDKLAFYSDQEAKQFIYEKLSSFCNIRDIQLRWLDEVFDLSAFVYLDPITPIHLTSIGKTAICNLTCNKCHSNRFNVTSNVFWNLLPSDSIGVVCL